MLFMLLLMPNARAATGNKPRHRYKRGYPRPSGSRCTTRRAREESQKYGRSPRPGPKPRKRPRRPLVEDAVQRQPHASARTNRPLVGDAVQLQPPSSARIEKRKKREDRTPPPPPSRSPPAATRGLSLPVGTGRRGAPVRGAQPTPCVSAGPRHASLPAPRLAAPSAPSSSRSARPAHTTRHPCSGRHTGSATVGLREGAPRGDARPRAAARPSTGRLVHQPQVAG